MRRREPKMWRHSIQTSMVLVPAPSFFQIELQYNRPFRNFSLPLAVFSVLLMHVKDVLQHRYDPFSRGSTCCTCCHCLTRRQLGGKHTKIDADPLAVIYYGSWSYEVHDSVGNHWHRQHMSDINITNLNFAVPELKKIYSHLSLFPWYNCL